MDENGDGVEGRSRKGKGKYLHVCFKVYRYLTFRTCSFFYLLQHAVDNQNRSMLLGTGEDKPSSSDEVTTKPIFPSLNRSPLLPRPGSRQVRCDSLCDNLRCREHSTYMYLAKRTHPPRTYLHSIQNRPYPSASQTDHT
jgi:hypothetical protein